MRRLPLLAAALAAATVSWAVPVGAAGPGFVLQQIGVTITGTSVTTSAKVATADGSSMAADYYGVCARTSTGGNVDFWKKPATITGAGTGYTSDTKTFPPGAYTFWACAHTSSGWSDIGIKQQFTTWATLAPAPTASAAPTPTPSAMPTASPTATPTPAASSTPTPTPTPTATSSSMQPNGPTGTWRLAFDDEFNGSSLDTSRWGYYCKTMNHVTTPASNVSVANGVATLRLSSTSAGAMISTASVDGCPAPSNRYVLPVGGIAEVRADFPAVNGSCANWPAWWASAASPENSWPNAGEHDIAETLSGQLTVNYHSPSGAHNTGAPAGTWCGGWHTYTLQRLAMSANVYWDGRLVRSYPTDDNGGPEALILNIGTGSTVDTSKPLQVDYVRAWQ